MLNMLMGTRNKKKHRNAATIGGAVSMAAVLGGLITWYAAKRLRNRREEDFHYEFDDDESQP